VESGKLANWLQILGNVGLVAGLILVAVQIKQNTDATKAQMISDGLAHYANLFLSIAGEDAASAWSNAIDTPDALSTEEIIVLDQMQFAHFFLTARTEYIAGLGYATLATEEAEIQSNAGRTVFNLFTNPHGYASYQETQDGHWAIATPKTKAAIDGWLQSLGADVQFQDGERVRRMKQRLSDSLPPTGDNVISPPSEAGPTARSQ
jgi:hypothetical protein